MNAQEFMIYPEDFFRGNGNFFVVDRDWGGHSHYLSTKYLFLHVASGELTLNDVESGLYSFLLSLEYEKHEIVNLFASVVYIYSELEKGSFESHGDAIDFFWPESRCYLAVKDYLSKINFNFSDEHYVRIIREKYPNSGLGMILSEVNHK